MDLQNESKLICAFCQKKFSSTSTKYRHLRNFHNNQVEQRKSVHILCSLCPKDKKDVFARHEELIEHLAHLHDVCVTQSLLNFTTWQDFEDWRKFEGRDVNYACHRRKKTKGQEYIYYNCNRSNSKGYTSRCKTRRLKAGGSIRITGICPSRILVKVFRDGSVRVKFVETHVGHDDELRTKRLTNAEQEAIVSQLTAGVTNQRIIEDARKIENSKLEHINIIKQADLAYLIRKFNIDKKRHSDDMRATALKIGEWNKQGTNHAFLFKQIGESYPGLKDDDFAVGYMNSAMEKKLLDFKRIICIDGTHGTNRRNWDLTTVLVVNDINMGFPVAFLLSNRLDQVIQTIFFRALKSRLGENIEAEYIISDDDDKYYNAWSQVMAFEKKPRRLLSTWSVIKNWNIQGRSKLKKLENRQEMKKEMRRILNETDITTFMQLKENYFKHLTEDGEIEFLKYLQKYYFQSSERIMMWSHCNRINASINTNMVIENLHKVLNYNKMNGGQNIRVEKLLDLLEELVNETLWNKITNSKRCHANNDQHKTTLEAHNKAEHQMKNTFKYIEVHKIKQGSESHAGPPNNLEYITEDPLDTLLVVEPAESQVEYFNEVNYYMEETCGSPHSKESLDFESRREIVSGEIYNTIKTLDEKSFEEFENFYREFTSNLEQAEIIPCKRWKTEKQWY